MAFNPHTRPQVLLCLYVQPRHEVREWRTAVGLLAGLMQRSNASSLTSLLNKMEVDGLVQIEKRPRATDAITLTAKGIAEAQALLALGWSEWQPGKLSQPPVKADQHTPDEEDKPDDSGNADAPDSPDGTSGLDNPDALLDQTPAPHPFTPEHPIPDVRTIVTYLHSIVGYKGMELTSEDDLTRQCANGLEWHYARADNMLRRAAQDGLIERHTSKGKTKSIRLLVGIEREEATPPSSQLQASSLPGVDSFTRSSERNAFILIMAEVEKGLAGQNDILAFLQFRTELTEGPLWRVLTRMQEIGAIWIMGSKHFVSNIVPGKLYGVEEEPKTKPPAPPKPKSQPKPNPRAAKARPKHRAGSSPFYQQTSEIEGGDDAFNGLEVDLRRHPEAKFQAEVTRETAVPSAEQPARVTPSAEIYRNVVGPRPWPRSEIEQPSPVENDAPPAPPAGLTDEQLDKIGKAMARELIRQASLGLQVPGLLERIDRLEKRVK